MYNINYKAGAFDLVTSWTIVVEIIAIVYKSNQLLISFFKISTELLHSELEEQSPEVSTGNVTMKLRSFLYVYKLPSTHIIALLCLNGYVRIGIDKAIKTSFSNEQVYHMVIVYSSSK